MFANVPGILTSNLVAFSEPVIGPLGTSLSPETLDVLRKIIILLVLNLFLLIVGMFIDIAPALLIVIPVVLPITDAIGMGIGLAAIHFSVLVVSNLIIGLVTPPVGSTLFVASAVGRVDLLGMTPYVLRFFGDYDRCSTDDNVHSVYYKIRSLFYELKIIEFLNELSK